jgi:hypothetical protein
MDGNFIFEMENFIPKELCDDIIQRFENEPQKGQSLIGDSTGLLLDLERRNSIHIHMRNMKDCQHIENELDSKTKDAINVYKMEFCNYFKRYNEDPNFINHVIFENRPIYFNEFVVQRVTPKSQFKWHTDEGEGYAHTGIIYLNNLDIKDGGATEFASGRKVQPKAGKLLLFPGGWSNVHRGCFVHKYKYMIIFGTQFVIPKAWSPFIISQE